MLDIPVRTPRPLSDQGVVEKWLSAVKRAFPDTEIACSGRILENPTVARLVVRQSLAVHVRSESELDRAVRVGVHASRIIAPNEVTTTRAGRIVSSTTQCGIHRVLAHRGTALVGLAGDLGADLANSEICGEAIRILVAEMACERAAHGTICCELHLHGGCTTAHHCGSASAWDPIQLSDAIENALDDSCARNRFPRPTVVLETL